MDKLLGTVIKAALATIVVTAAVKIVVPAISKWRRKDKLRKEKAAIERELEEREWARKERERIDFMFEAMDRARRSVGLIVPPGDGNN